MLLLKNTAKKMYIQLTLQEILGTTTEFFSKLFNIIVENKIYRHLPAPPF